jgi:predicted deacetylase
MLVIPDHWRGAPIAGNAAFQARLRGWADMGIEMFLHGWAHKDETPATQGLAGFKGKHMTAGEGEFLNLSHAQAVERMSAGKALVEDILGRPVAGFIAPAWLYGEGAHAALSELGFALAEDHMKVWRPADGMVLAKGPVITWASRSKARIASSLWFSALARQALPALRHSFTHFRLLIQPVCLHLEPRVLSIASPGQQWLTPAAALKSALPTPVRTLIHRLV